MTAGRAPERRSVAGVAGNPHLPGGDGARQVSTAHETAQNDSHALNDHQPSSQKYRRLKILAQSRGTSVNRLIDEMTTQMLAEFDAETRFQLRAERGAEKVERGLEMLEKAGGG